MDQASASALADLPPSRRTLLLAWVCIGVVYVGSAAAKWWPTPDSAVYLGLARSLAGGEGFRFNGELSTRAAPGLPVILAAWSKLFGDSFTSFHVLVAGCAVGGLALAYVCLRRLADARTALAAVLATAFSYTFFHNAHRILTDVPFTPAFWGIVYCVLRLRGGSRGWLAPMALLTAAGLAIRIPAVVLTGAVAIALAADRRTGATAKKLAAAGTILAVTALSAAGFFLLAQALSPETPYYVSAHVHTVSRDLTAYLTLPLTTAGHFVVALAEMLTSQDGWPSVAAGAGALVLLAIGLAVNWVRGRRCFAVALVLYLGALAVLSTPAVGMRPRYLLPIQPLLILLIMQGLFWTIRRLALRTGSRAPRPRTYLKAAVVMTAAIIAVNAPRLGRNAVYYTYLSYRGDYYQHLRQGKFADLFPVAEKLRSVSGAAQVVASYQPQILHYVSGLRTIDLPTTARRSVADADTVLEFVRSRTDLAAVVVPACPQPRPGDPTDKAEKDDGAKGFHSHLAAGLQDDPDMELIYKGKILLAYRRRE